MALTLLSANNASTVLSAGISASATTLTVNTGTGGLFPSPVSGTSFFKLTLVDSATGTLTEIVHVTARTGDTMTIVRGQEGTTNRLWSANDIAANMMTAGTLSSLAQKDLSLQIANNLSEIAAAGPASIAASLANLGLSDVAHLPQLTGVVGTSRNARMSVTAASATATFTADELIVQSALGGRQYKLISVNKTINLATTGAGGMDTGSAPVSGYVAIYAIYNPTTQASALLAVNATLVTAPEVYGGANMPSGYTASALVSVWATNGSGQFIPGFLTGRDLIFMANAVITSSSIPTSMTALSLATAVPLNAICVRASVRFTSITGTGAAGYVVASDAQEICRSASGAYASSSVLPEVTPFSLGIITKQLCYHRISISGVTGYTYILYITGYSI